MHENENDELDTTKLDISKTGINENDLDTFLQGAYDRTVDVSHNNNCTFHSMGRNLLEMYLEDQNNNINGLGEKIIKKLLKKHGNKLKNPIWTHAGWHPFGSFAYRKSFLESVKYYFSNATWGWLNIFNPFFWLSELIWGEYGDDFYGINTNNNNEIKLHIDQNLSEKEKYRIGNILGQLIREEIANAIAEAKNYQKNEANLETNNIGGFVNLDQVQKSNETDKLKIDPKPKMETKLSYKKKMTQSILDASPRKKFDVPYVDQGSRLIVYEWQYLTSNDFLEETNENNPLKTIVLEINKKPVSAENAKLVFSDFDCALHFDQNINDIKSQLGEYCKITDINKLPLICIMDSGWCKKVGRCQPIVGGKKKLQFIKNLLNAITKTYDNRVSIDDKKIYTLGKSKGNNNIYNINNRDLNEQKS